MKKRLETDRNFAERRVGGERRPNFRLLPVFRKASAARGDYACGVVQRRQEFMCQGRERRCGSLNIIYGSETLTAER